MCADRSQACRLARCEQATLDSRNLGMAAGQSPSVDRGYEIAA